MRGRRVPALRRFGYGSATSSVVGDLSDVLAVIRRTKSSTRAIVAIAHLEGACGRPETKRSRAIDKAVALREIACSGAQQWRIEVARDLDVEEERSAKCPPRSESSTAGPRRGIG